MKEVIFEVSDAIEGGFIASGLGVPIHTQSETLEDLRVMVKDAVQCHFEDCPENERPRIIRLHFVRDEVFAL